MAISVAGFRATFPADKFPQFAGISDAEIQVELDIAVAMIDKDRWDACSSILYESGVYYLAAHNLQLWLNAGGEGSSVSGPRSSDRVGEVATTYQQLSTNNMTEIDIFYRSTPFGFRFLSWMLLIGVGAIIVC